MYAGAARRKMMKREEPQQPIIEEEDTNRRMGNYQMLESIGRGGFGVVYRGLNTVTAETVAVKRVGLRNVPADELEAIELEIKLMQGLDHPNIVKYKDAMRSEMHLNIILEFVENGSLTSLQNKFGGRFPESLVAVYIAQVVLGLAYLHSQGVIHRDIKGANILSTKEGLVKLADFGVATKLNETKEADSVAGTPYWMAPEIIEMSGIISPACDIWSVGCTVIELLTGKPPYFDMQQMAALFRIVQDDHPPLPDDISKFCSDFLLECFQKDPNRRISATQLLRHPWIKEHVQLQTSREQPEPVQTPQDKIPRGLISLDAFGEGDDDDDMDWDKSLEIEEKNDKPRGTSVAKASATKKNVASPAASSPLNDDDDFFDDMSDDDDKPVAKSSPRQDSMQLDVGANPLDRLNKFAENDDMDDDDNDWADILDDEPKTLGGDDATWDDDDLELFDDIGFDEKSDVTSVILNKFDKLTASLSLRASSEQVLDTVMKMATMFEENTEVLRSAVTSRGVIPIMEMLEFGDNTVLLAVLRLVNLIVADNQKFQQNMSLVGLIPALIKFSGRSYDYKIRLEAAHFIRVFCYTSDFTRKMFVACGGIPALVVFLKEDYKESKELVLNAIDCMRHIFDITTSPRNDFCRLFCKFGVLLPLTQTFLAVHIDALNRSHGIIPPPQIEHRGSVVSRIGDDISDRLIPSSASAAFHDADPEEYVNRIATILEWFANGDSVVNAQFINVEVQRILVRMLYTLPQTALLPILKSLRAVSMNPYALDSLAEAGAIPALIPFLSSKLMENQAQVLQTMYYLCYFNVQRVEEAARYGIIPHLQRIITTKLPFNQFAYSVLFSVCNASSYTRDELRKHDGIQFLLDILSDPCWRGNSLESLAIWNTQEPERVGPIILIPSNINRLLPILKSYNALSASTTLGPSLMKYVSSHHKLLQAVGRVFIPHILSSLIVHKNDNNTRNLFLTLLKDILFCDVPNIAAVVKKYDVKGFLVRLGEDASATVVSARATNILESVMLNHPHIFA